MPATAPIESSTSLPRGGLGEIGLIGFAAAVTAAVITQRVSRA
jgi:hypothetical protein